MVQDTKISRFEAIINGFLEKGWVCQGGVSVIKYSLVEMVYSQAMIKDSE